MRKWLGRLAVTIESLSMFWLIGWSLYVAIEDERLGNVPSDIVDALGFILGPGLAGIAIAWVLDRFARPN